MPNELLLPPPEFKKGYQAFQKREPRDAMYKTATFLVQHFWGQAKDMADGLGVLLLTWNQAFYRYGFFDFARLEDALRTNLAVIEGFREREIRSFGEADDASVRQLFLAFLEALQISEGKNKGRKTPVGVAKALHLLAPAFFPIWDYEIATAYGCYYNPQPDDKYVTFMRRMQCLERQLQKHVPAGYGRTFLKLIDEYNYAKYTKRWL